ncbi:hypothetical protein BCR42DRAFT_467162 [Absidia repens]|uniref:Pectin lyase fold/virulence factor n=1 Tax=Absidia repens TaxID=90262 RepID=A0A1X2IBN9_9FUNG|nr:hypothetical protein BCR42DRAFT_467162 [Absidia repens]
MKTLFIVVFTLLFVCAQSQELCQAKSAAYYHTDVEDYTDILQELIDKASDSDQHALLLKPGRFGLRGQDPIVLKPGVSMHGNKDEPTIFTTLVDLHSNESATIQVPAASIGWSVSGIIFDNVNIDIQPQQNAEVAKIENNVFLNGGRGSIKSSFGSNLLIDSNIFLRDHAHAGTVFIPKYDTTNAGIVFQTQENSVITNNIFGMDLRQMDNIIPHVSADLQSSFKKIKYALACLKLKWDDQQGFLASAIQLYSTNEITIRANIMNATFPDTMPIAQDHAISVVGSNQTYVVQNFIAGWELADFGGAVRFTSAVDSYVVSNYLANTAVMMYVANHADFMQVDNLVVYNNFLYRFLDHNVDPPAPLDGWLYEGITFFDFWTARRNNTIRPPIWNSSVPISPHAHNIVITNNKFGAAQGIDPNVISMGNLDPAQAKVDKKNCYVTRPLIPTATNNRVPLLWRQNYRSDMSASFGGKIPTHFKHPKSRKLIQHVPEELRRLPVLDYWKAFTLRNATVPMISPEAPCFNMLY